MNDDEFQERLSYLKKQAMATKAWVDAGFPMGDVPDEFDTYPTDLFQASATPEFILEMIKRLETK